MANRALGEPGRVEGAVFHVKHSFEKPSPVRRRGGGCAPTPCACGAARLLGGASAGATRGCASRT